jgi:hypothetical protein
MGGHAQLPGTPLGREKHNMAEATQLLTHPQRKTTPMACFDALTRLSSWPLGIIAPMCVMSSHSFLDGQSQQKHGQVHVFLSPPLGRRKSPPLVALLPELCPGIWGQVCTHSFLKPEKHSMAQTTCLLGCPVEDNYVALLASHRAEH